MKPRRSAAIWILAVAMTLLFAGKQVAVTRGSTALLFSDRLTLPAGALAKLIPLLAGALYAARCVPHYEPKTLIRRAWLAMSLWFGAFFVGQSVLTFYVFGLDRAAPIPSTADAAFIVGYALVIAAASMFIHAYRVSGFPVGKLSEHLSVAAVACGAFTLVGASALSRVLHAPLPLAERLIDAAYPILDLLLMILSLVLLRITVRFQGGRVWSVWAALLVGIVAFSGGDLLFAGLSADSQAAFGPMIDLSFILGYLFSCHGAVLQYELLAD